MSFMPHDKSSLPVLEQRAKQLALEYEAVQDVEEQVSFIQFSLDEESYGIPYAKASEVLYRPHITPIPLTDSSIAGTTNRRGNLLPVFNLKKILNKKNTSYTESYYVIFVSDGKNEVGLLADEIEASSSYFSGKLESFLAGASSIKQDYILGLHNCRTAIIEIDAVLMDISKTLEGGA